MYPFNSTNRPKSPSKEKPAFTSKYVSEFQNTVKHWNR